MAVELAQIEIKTVTHVYAQSVTHVCAPCREEAFFRMQKDFCNRLSNDYRNGGRASREGRKGREGEEDLLRHQRCRLIPAQASGLGKQALYRLQAEGPAS
jgi:hypothetical protein